MCFAEGINNTRQKDWELVFHQTWLKVELGSSWAEPSYLAIHIRSLWAFTRGPSDCILLPGCTCTGSPVKQLGLLALFYAIVLFGTQQNLECQERILLETQVFKKSKQFIISSTHINLSFFFSPMPLIALYWGEWLYEFPLRLYPSTVVIFYLPQHPMKQGETILQKNWALVFGFNLWKQGSCKERFGRKFKVVTELEEWTWHELIIPEAQKRENWSTQRSQSSQTGGKGHCR